VVLAPWCSDAEDVLAARRARRGSPTAEGPTDPYGVNEDVVGYAWMLGVILCRLTGGDVSTRGGS